MSRPKNSIRTRIDPLAVARKFAHSPFLSLSLSLSLSFPSVCKLCRYTMRPTMRAVYDGEFYAFHAYTPVVLARTISLADCGR